MVKPKLRTLMFENDNLKDIAAILKTGGLILYPTDTIWGIGCDATNADAVNRVYELKQRDKSKSFVLLANSLEMVKKYVVDLHPRIDTLLHFHVRPLTVVYDQARNLPNNVTAADGSIAIRIVQDSFCQKLIAKLGRPLVSTSANISNEPFPTHFGSISSAVIRGVDYVVKYRQHERPDTQPSVVVRFDKDGELIFLRN